MNHSEALTHDAIRISAAASRRICAYDTLMLRACHAGNYALADRLNARVSAVRASAQAAEAYLSAYLAPR